MPSIANGANATGTLTPNDTINVDASGGYARVECPTGTVIGEFRGSRSFGPFDNLTYRITSLQGALYYEIADGPTPLVSSSGVSGFTASTYEVSGLFRLLSYVAGGVTYAVAYGANTITVTGSDASTKLITLDGSGRIVSVV